VTTLTDLEAAYKRLLGTNTAVVSSGEANDAFELYTLSLVLHAAREEGAAIQFLSSGRKPNPSPLHFRASPGTIFSSAHDYTHAQIEFPGNFPLEAHVGVYVEGLAGVVHECDVLVIDAAEGIFCRRHRVHPKKSKMVLAAECKFYTGNLGIDLGRQFLGVTTDLGTTGRFFLSNSDGKSVDRVLAHHKRDRFFGLTPLDIDGEGQVIAMFRTTFRDWKAKRR
jgi:hypothetical protein